MNTPLSSAGFLAAPYAAPIGTPLDQIDTPALCLELPVLDDNIQHMASLCRQHGVAWRPHAKGHKSPHIARRQLAAGALGITCAKLSEAEVFAHDGIQDLLIANQIVGPAKFDRLISLCRIADPIVAVDSTEQILPLAKAARAAGVQPRVVIEIDLGLARAGVLPGTPALELARLIVAQTPLRLAGIMGYEGHLLTLPDLQEKDQRIRAAMAQLIHTRDALLHAHLPCDIVSAGGTGSYATTVTCPGITELQAGGLVFMDAFYRQRCQVRDFDFALTLLATVVSRPAPDRMIIDAGRKSQNAEVHPPRILAAADVELLSLSAEHGTFRLGPRAPQFRVGDRVRLIPGYADFTCVLHDVFHVIDAGHVVDIWPLTARGRLQ